MPSVNYEKTVTTTSIIAWIVLFITVIGSLTWYTSTSGGHITNNQQSSAKITAIDEAMSSAMGQNWPVVLLVIVVFIAMFLFTLYTSIQKNSITISLSDNLASRLNTILIILTILFSIFMVILAVNSWLNYKKREETGDSPNYKPTIEQQKKNQQILAIIGLGLLILIGGIYGVKYFLSNK